MINKKEKQDIKTIIGHRYVSLIQEELEASKEFNKSGNPYSSAHITNVMNGESHEVIEAAIYRVVAKKKALLDNRKNLLKSA